MSSTSLKESLGLLIDSFGPKADRKKSIVAALEALLLDSLNWQNVESVDACNVRDTIPLLVSKYNPDMENEMAFKVQTLMDEVVCGYDILHLLLLLSEPIRKPNPQGDMANLIFSRIHSSFTPIRKRLNPLLQSEPMLKDGKQSTNKENIQKSSNPGCERISKKVVSVNLELFKIAISDVLIGVQNPLFHFDSQFEFENCAWSFTEGWALQNRNIQTILPLLNPIFDARAHYEICEQFVVRRETTCHNSSVWPHLFSCLNRLLISYAYDTNLIINSEESSLHCILEDLNVFFDGIESLSVVCQKLDDILNSKPGDNIKVLLDVLHQIVSISVFPVYSRSILINLFHTSYEIYVRELLFWISEGPHYKYPHNLFLKCNLSSLACKALYSDRLLWTSAFYVDKRNVPDILDPSLCEKLLECAKLTYIMNISHISIASLTDLHIGQSHCSECLPGQLDIEKVRANRFKKLESENLFHFQPQIPVELTINRKVKKLVENRLSALNSTFFDYLFTNCDLQFHLSNLRQIFLCENGSFVSCFAENLFCTFSDNFNDSPSLLVDVLETALAFGGLENCQNYVLVAFTGRGGSAVSSCSTNSTSSHFAFDSVYRGVETVTIRYKISWPCNLIIGKSCLEGYSEILVLLVQLHCLQHSLSDVLTFLNQTNIFTNIQKHRLYLYRFIMQQFLAVVKDYLCTRLREVCQNLESDLGRNSEYAILGVDALHQIHNQHISRALCLCLLNPKAQRIKDVFDQTLAQILKLRAAVVLRNDLEKADKVFRSFTNCSRYFVQLMRQLNSRGYESSLADLVLRLNFNKYLD